MFRLITRGFMQVATLQIEAGLQKCIRMGITIFKILIWGGISSDIRSEITSYDSALASLQNYISDHMSNDIPPQKKILNTVIPLIILTHK